MFAGLGIRTKIALVAALTTVCLLSAVGAIGYRSMVSATRQSQIDLLNERIDEVESQLESDDGVLVGRSRIDSSVRIVRAGSPLPPDVEDTLRVVREHSSDDIQALVGLADTQRIDATLRTIWRVLWISILVIGALVGVTSYLVVGRALAPVRRLTTEAETNMLSRSIEPVTADGGPDEISQLAATFNAMLRRLRGADSDRRRFVSDASHELRTPLMVLSADAEYALEHPTDTRHFAKAVLDQTDRLTLLVDDLLLLASLDEAQMPTGGSVTVERVLERADASPALDSCPSELRSAAIPDVSRAVGNVIANARRHARDRVDIAVACDGQHVAFTVDDDGPGVPVSEREAIFKRFYRPDGDRNRADGGAGLGLAIAKAEVVGAQGEIRVEDSPAGGARFVLTVPVAEG